ncbi:TetR/AcrR family transcriptional regulator [Mycobacterium sp. URHB0021]
MAKECDLRRVHPADRSGSSAVIRDAALRRFAAQGVAVTTLRLIASDAGISLGLVQHRFGTMERLVEAVHRYVLEVAKSQLALDFSRDGADEESAKTPGGVCGG